jgi:soluble lytic murein transglycosylase
MRPWLIAAAFLLLAGGAQAQDRAVAATAAAMDAVRAGDFARAAEVARPGGEVVRDLVEWHRLREGQGTLGDVRSFLARNPDWPGLAQLRERGERHLREATDPAAVIAYFDGETPRTATGLRALNLALRASDRRGDAEALAIRAWTSGHPLTADLETAWLEVYPNNLGQRMTARLDALLWEGEVEAAERMLPRVDAGWRALAQARIALRAERDGVNALIDAVPGALAGDAGLAYERFRWRMANDRADAARELILERSTSAEALGRPEAWSSQRRTLARAAMRAGDARTAYRLAAQHFLPEGEGFTDYADLEWLSGYIALRYLEDPSRALAHFRRFEAVVGTPISLARAGYWIGRAEEAAGNRDAAMAAYARGGQHQTAFYGQLAAERAGLPMDPALANPPRYADWQGRGFASSSVLAAGVLLMQAGEVPLAARFLAHLAEGLGPDDLGSLGQLALDMDQPHVAIAVAKHAATRGIVLPGPLFPMHPMARADLPVPRELALSIARRESEFHVAARSGAGALGLMQLMPGTAQDVSRDLGLPYDRAALTRDPVYNARLGSAYLAGLKERFGPSVALVAAGYNAGPSRPARWIEDFGDPRSDRVDVVDWVEHVPFVETQTYIMRVMETIPIYRARLAGAPQPWRLTDELRGR